MIDIKEAAEKIKGFRAEIPEYGPELEGAAFDKESWENAAEYIKDVLEYHQRCLIAKDTTDAKQYIKMLELCTEMAHTAKPCIT